MVSQPPNNKFGVFHEEVKIETHLGTYKQFSVFFLPHAHFCPDSKSSNHCTSFQVHSGSGRSPTVGGVYAFSLKFGFQRRNMSGSMSCFWK